MNQNDLLKNKRVLAIVPAYKGSQGIRNTVEDIRSKAPFLDIVVVNDCSPDDTKAVLAAMDVRSVSLPWNLGIGGAVQTGFKYAFTNGYDIALQIDGDGQHSPEQVMDLIAPLLRGECDIVIGSRYLEKGGFMASRARRVGIWLFSALTSAIIGQKVTDVTSGFRAYNRAALEFCEKHYPVDFPDSEAIILFAFAGLRIKELSVTMKARTHGASSTRFLKSLYYPFKNLVSILGGVLRRQKADKKP